ncbi:MAG: GTP 3',8-cyclase MoaA [Bilophila sp.]
MNTLLSPFMDRYGRAVRYIRLSVTDRCNLRCTYCRSGMETFIPHESILRYEEMEQLVALAVEQGVRKVRLTGGEPFARKGFVSFLERLRRAHPDLDICITTNGTLLSPHILALKELGLGAINLSLDTFNRKTFERITGRDLLFRVLESVELLLAAKIPFKINTVAMRGVNDTELPAFLDFAMSNAVDVRFIEFMPMGEGTRWTEGLFWSASALLEAAQKLVRVTPVDTPAHNSGPARLYDLAPLVSAPSCASLSEHKGRLGLISPLSSHFCATCNRLRFTSEGALRTCLFDDREYRLRAALRHPRLGIDAVRRIIALATRDKPIGAHILEQRNTAVAQRRMTAIGG